jgi:hypothetical protein
LFRNLTSGYVGIGTNTPRELLEVDGGLLISNTATNNNGTMRWNGSDYEGYVNGTWKSFTKQLLAGEGSAGQVAYWESSTFIGGDNNLFWDLSNEYLGIGTDTPREMLEVAGGIRIGNTTAFNTGAMRWSGMDYEGYNGSQWLSFTSSTLTGEGTPKQVTFWNSPSNLTGNNNLYWDNSNTFLGIGTTTPREALDVAGGVKVGNTSGSSSTVTGTIRWTGSDFEGYDGTTWISFTLISSLNGYGEYGQIAYWDAPDNLAGDYENYFDFTNKRHGIGTQLPTTALTVDDIFRVGGSTKNGELLFYSESGLSDFMVGLQASSTMTENTKYYFPPQHGVDEEVLTTDGLGYLYWAEPTIALGDYWKLTGDVLQTVGNWGIARYTASITAPDVETQINFGVNSTSSGSSSAIMGGLDNLTGGSYSFISGGESNSATSNYSYIFGGSGNTASGLYSRVSGSGNTVSGDYSVISGGQNLTLSGARSYAFRGGLSTAPYTLTAAGTYNVVDANFHYNPTKGDYDLRIDGDNTNNVLFVDASTNRVGITTATPAHLLEVPGNVAITNNSATASSIRFQEPSGSGNHYSSWKAREQATNLIYRLPPWHNVEHSALFNFGEGTLEWASPEQVTTYLRVTVIQTSVNYTPEAWNVHIVVSNTNAVTITLPPADQLKGKRYFIKKTSATGGGRDVTVGVTGGSGNTIDGATSKKLTKGMEGAMFASDGINWYIYSHYKPTN